MGRGRCTVSARGLQAQQSSVRATRTKHGAGVRKKRTPMPREDKEAQGRVQKDKGQEWKDW